MQFNLTFNMNNDAFYGADRDYEVKRILEEVVVDIMVGDESRIIKDINGNAIGKWSIDKGVND